MSRDLEHLLNATAAEPSRPVDPSEIARRARRRRRQRHAGTTMMGIMATAGLVAALAVPLSGGADGVTTPPAAEPDTADARPDARADLAEPYSPGFDCPVTEAPAPGFAPPGDYPARPSSDDAVWFGTEELWTVLPMDGQHGERKSVWWSTSFPGGEEEPRPRIDVTWERLDLRDPVRQRFTTNPGFGTNGHTAADGWFMIAGKAPGEHGCWQVTAKYKGAELSYVYEIPA